MKSPLADWAVVGALSDLFGGVSLSDLRVISAASCIGFTNQKFYRNQHPATSEQHP